MSKGGYGSGPLSIFYGICAAFMAFSSAYQCTYASRYIHNYDPMDLMITIGLWILFTKLSKSARKSYQRKMQDKRNAVATRIIADELNIINSKIKDYNSNFFLYLRPFVVSNKILIENPRITKIFGILWPTYAGEPDKVDLEFQLSRAVKWICPMIKIGGYSVGGGTVNPNNEEWKELFLDCALRAKLIFIVPFYRPGLSFEVESLKYIGILEKVMFIMPPVFDLNGRPATKLWEESVLAYKSLGIDLPPYTPNGLLFTLHNDGKLAKIIKPGSFSTMRILITINRYMGQRKINKENIEAVLARTELAKQNLREEYIKQIQAKEAALRLAEAKKREEEAKKKEEEAKKTLVTLTKKEYGAFLNRFGIKLIEFGDKWLLRYPGTMTVHAYSYDDIFRTIECLADKNGIRVEKDNSS